MSLKLAKGVKMSKQRPLKQLKEQNNNQEVNLKERDQIRKRVPKLLVYIWKKMG